MRNVAKSREKRIEFVKRQLLQNSFPRVQISIILALTALTGFLTSVSLLRLEIYSMTLRYPISIAAAYCVFLLLLRLWLLLQNPRSGVELDLPESDFSDLSNSFTDNITDTELNFSGGGVSESVSSTAGSSSVLDGSSWDLEEIGLIIIAVVAIIGGLVAVFYVVYIAPILLAEILVDGVLITGLYNRVKKIERRYWLETAVKKTLLPAVLAALFFGLAGFAMQKISPEARSIGETFSYMTGNK